jgi:hypothetical protein
VSSIVENPQAYFRRFVAQRDALLTELESEAAHEDIPINRHIHSSPDWLSVSVFAFLPQHSPENDGLCLALRL